MNHLSSFTQQSVNDRISKSIPGFMDKVSSIQDYVVDLFDDFHEFNSCYISVCSHYKMMLHPIYSAEISKSRVNLYFNKHLFEKPGRIDLNGDSVFYSILLSFNPVPEANYSKCYYQLSILCSQIEESMGLTIFGMDSKYDYILRQIDEDGEADSFEDGLNVDYSTEFSEPPDFGDQYNELTITYFDMCLVSIDDKIAQKHQW